MTMNMFLEDLGFSSYEKSIILALGKVHEATAQQVYNESQVPYGRLYSVLIELEKKGIVRSYPTTPKTYKIDNLKVALEKFLEKKRTELLEQSNRLASLDDMPKKFSFAKNSSVLIFRGVEQKLGAIESLYAGAAKEVVRVAPLFTQTSFTASERHLDPSLLRLIVGKVTPKNEKLIYFLKSRGAQVRSLPENRLSMVMVDSKHLLFDAQEYEKEDRLTIYSKNAALIASLRETFERLWDQSKPL